MSPPCCSLLALAATALLHAGIANGSEPQCNSAEIGDSGTDTKEVLKLHINRTQSVIDLPADACAEPTSKTVGVVVTACDPFGAAPQVELRDGRARAAVACAWTSGQTCPAGLDLVVTQNCAPSL